MDYNSESVVSVVIPIDLKLTELLLPAVTQYVSSMSCAITSHPASRLLLIHNKTGRGNK